MLQQRLDEKGDSGRVKSQEIKELLDQVQNLKKENKQLRAREQQVGQSQSDQALKKVQEIEAEKRDLEQQVAKEQEQYIKMHEKLIAAEKTIKSLTNGDESLIPKEGLADKLESVQQKLQDTEQSNKVLRRIKNAYKQAAEIKCRGCLKTFQPVIFKGHILNCQKLFEDPESFQDIAQNSEID